AFNACLAKYGNVTEQDEYLPISADTFHAEAYIQAYVNALKGGDSYLLSFDLENHTSHANDLTFFFGLHPVQGRNMTPEEQLMDEYYPEMVKRFLRTGKPAKDWQPLDRNGSNYYVLEFSVENDTIVEQPHPVSDYYDPEALKFWLTDMANIEREAEGAENSTSLPWRPTVGNWPFPKGHEHDYDWLTPRPHYRPSAGSWPFPKGKEHDYDWLTPRPRHIPSSGNWPFPKGKEHDYDWLTPQPPLQLHQLPPVGRWPIVKTQRPPYWTYLNRLNLMAQPPETAAVPEQVAQETADRDAEDSLPIREVWSAFWLMMSLAILLTAVILLMVATRLVYRFKNVRGYSYNYDDGFFTEKSKIITVGNNGTRYT
ncbi:Protein E01G6.3, partial [Aphelenchoides avenae]